MNFEIFTLTPSDLHETAKTMARPDAAERHWSRLAAILGRIEHQGLYHTLGGGYGSTRAYAEEELGIGFTEYNELMVLWKMISTPPGVTVNPQKWLRLRKTHALLLKRILSLGGDPAVWLDRALEAPTVSSFRKEITRLLGKEEWITRSVSMPIELDGLTDEALAMAYQEATGSILQDPEELRARGNQFRCWELIVKHFMSTYRPFSGE